MEELEVMRMQLEAVKRQLETQEIVNNMLLKKIMRRKASWLNQFVTFEIIILPIVSLMIALICDINGLSQWYTVCFTVLAVADTAFDWRTVRIPPEKFGNSIIELKRFLIRQQKARFIQVCISLPAVFIWLAMFYMAICSKLGVYGETMDNFIAAEIAGGVLGGVIAVIVIFILYWKMNRTTKTLLRDISELEDEAAQV